MEKPRGLRSGLFAGQTSLLMNEGIFLWIQNWVILEAWESAGTRQLLGGATWPRAADNLPKCRRWSAGSSIWLQRAQKAEGLQVSVTAAQTMTDCGFWRLVAILLSVDDEEAQTSSFCWFTTCWMSNFCSSVNTRFGSVPSAISWRIFLHFWALMATWLAVSSWRCSLLKSFTPQIVPQHLVHVGFTHSGCGGQGSAASARVSSQLFPRIFEELRGADTSFSSAPWSFKGVCGLLELLHDLPHRWMVWHNIRQPVSYTERFSNAYTGGIIQLKTVMLKFAYMSPPIRNESG